MSFEPDIYLCMLENEQKRHNKLLVLDKSTKYLHFPQNNFKLDFLASVHFISNDIDCTCLETCK